MTDGPDTISALAGQMIVGRLPGFELDAEHAEALASGIMGGITLFKENAESLDQLVELVDAIHEKGGPGVLVAVDQEGGAVQRFDHLITPLPSAMALSAREDLAAASQSVYETTALTAAQLKLIGVNCVFAPVLDVLTNPQNPVIATRAFSSDAARVRDLGFAVAKGYLSHGLMPVGKHFPGHGNTNEDSHSKLAVSQVDVKSLWRVELLPFRSNLSYLPAVMTGHIWLPGVDAMPMPGSLSARITGGLLREYLGFDGLVFTDDLMMQGITNQWGLAEAAVMAVKAGADRLLVCGGLADIKSVHDALVTAVKEERISHARLLRSQERYGRATAGLGLDAGLPEYKPGPRKERLSKLKKLITQGRNRVKDASLAGVSLLRGQVPAIVSGEWVIVAPAHPRYAIDLITPVKAALKKAGSAAKVNEVRYPLNPDEADRKKLVDKCSGKNCIFLTYRTLNNLGQVALARELSECTESKVAVATDMPYDIVGLPNWTDCLATFDPSDLAMESLALILAGESEPTGMCPVSLQFQL